MGAISRFRMRRTLRRVSREVKQYLVPAIFALIVLAVVIIYFSRAPSARKATNNKQNSIVKENESSKDLLREINQALENGEFGRAENALDEAIRANPDDELLRMLESQFVDELKVNFAFNYLPGRRKHVQASESSDEITLSSEDPYYLNVHASDRCYLYLYQIDSSGKFFQLFPNKRFVPTSNPIPAGPLRVPDAPEWFYLDDTPGLEQIFLIASRWPQTRLEKASANLSGGASPQSGALDDFFSVANNIKQEAENFPSLVFGAFKFGHIAK